MMEDLYTVMQKELREYFAAGSSRRGALLGILIIFAIFGVVIPLENGHTWVTSPFVVAFYGIYLPLSLVTSVIADSFAGERERHTLETLLASRLSDRSILFGKLGAALAYSWVLSMATAIAGMFAANVKGGGRFVVYPAGIALAIAVAAALTSLLYAGIGVQLSLRAATVRQTQQAMTIVFLVVLVLPFLIFSLLSPLQKQHLLESLTTTVNWAEVGIIVGIIVLVLDVLLLVLALARFQRARLILS
ncbi:MAG: ABC transporter permease [Ktedonobacterales bacterium]